MQANVQSDADQSRDSSQGLRSSGRQQSGVGRPLLTARQAAAEVFGVSERTFHAMREKGMLPMPVCIGPRCLRWVRSELEQAVANLPRQRERVQPERLKRGQFARAAAPAATPVEA